MRLKYAHMHGMYFFTVVSFYAYLEGMWILNIAAVVLAYIPHSYMIIVPFTQAVHYIVTHWKKFTLKNH